MRENKFPSNKKGFLDFQIFFFLDGWKSSGEVYLEVKFGNHKHIYKGNEEADNLAGIANDVTPVTHRFPTSTKNFFVGNHRTAGRPVTVSNIGAAIKKAQHKQWRA